jgi:hypothetical protein
MKIYLASLNLYALEKCVELLRKKKTKPNVLRSFGIVDAESSAFIKDHRDSIGSLALDSGTWTLNNAKYRPPHLTFENYMDYVKEVKSELDFYVNFDSNFTDEGYVTNIQNLKEMEERELEPVPVVHDIWAEEIDLYIDEGYRRIALGSSQIRDLETMEYVINKFQGTGIKIHLFGKSGFDFMANFPIDSCDTADWAHAGSFGHILYWNPRRSEINKGDQIYTEERTQKPGEKKVTFSNYEFREDLDKYLYNTFGYVYEKDILGPEGSYVKMVINAFYYLQLEDEINKIHKRKGFKTD